MGIKYIVIGIACIVIVSWVWKTMKWVWYDPRKTETQLRGQGLNGSSYKFLFGDTKESFSMQNEAKEKPIPFTNDYFSRILPFLHQQFNAYGESFFTWMGPIPVVNIAEQEQIKAVFTRINEFQKGASNPLVALLVPGLVIAEGEKWVKHRKLLNPAFRMEKLKLMQPAFGASVSEMVNQWDTIVSKSGSSEVDVWPYLSILTADAISRAAFGSSFEEGRKIFELLREQTEITLRLLQSVYIPGWMYVPTKTNRRMKELYDIIQHLLAGIIEKRLKAMEVGEPAKDDLVGILLDSNFKESESLTSSKKKLCMTFPELIDECKLFYLAGHESTSALLVWTMILLSKHTDWQKRAREEVLATFGTDEPDFDRLNQLKIVTMILNEVLRLYPPAVNIIRRNFNCDVKLGNLLIPRDAMVTISAYHIQRDPKIWGDNASEFSPERFSEGVANATKGNIAFFPFGWGPRICIGQNFALTEAKMAITMILQRFSFELSSSYTHAPTKVLTLQPQYGAHLVLHKLQRTK